MLKLYHAKVLLNTFRDAKNDFELVKNQFFWDIVRNPKNDGVKSDETLKIACSTLIYYIYRKMKSNIDILD